MTATTETTTDEYLARALNAISLLPNIHADLDSQIAIESTGTSYGDRVSGANDEDYVPINTNVIDLQNEIIDKLGGWAEMLATDHLGKLLRDRWPTTSAQVLRDNWDLIVAAYWAFDMAEEVLAVFDRAQRYSTRRLHDVGEHDRIADGLADTATVARLLGVTVRRVQQFAKDGSLPVAERGAHGRSYYLVADVRALAEQRGVQAVAA